MTVMAPHRDKKKRAARPAALQKAYRGKHSFVAERSKPFTGPGRGVMFASRQRNAPRYSLLDQTKSKTEKSVGRPGSRKALGACSFVRSLSGHHAEP